MTETPTAIIVNCETGEITQRPFTEEELEAQAIMAKKFAEEEAQAKAELEAKAEAKASAQAKLAALGLTPEEIAALS